MFRLILLQYHKLFATMSVKSWASDRSFFFLFLAKPFFAIMKKQVFFYNKAKAGFKTKLDIEANLTACNGFNG
jgi:hypothetical protein